MGERVNYWDEIDGDTHRAFGSRGNLWPDSDALVGLADGVGFKLVGDDEEAEEWETAAEGELPATGIAPPAAKRKAASRPVGNAPDEQADRLARVERQLAEVVGMLRGGGGGSVDGPKDTPRPPGGAHSADTGLGAGGGADRLDLKDLRKKFLGPGMDETPAPSLKQPRKAPAPEKEVSGVVKELNFGGGENEEEDEELIPSSQSQEQVQRIEISLTGQTGRTC